MTQEPNPNREKNAIIQTAEQKEKKLFDEMYRKVIVFIQKQGIMRALEPTPTIFLIGLSAVKDKGSISKRGQKTLLETIEQESDAFRFTPEEKDFIQEYVSNYPHVRLDDTVEEVK
ncbi:MAG: hypothetical protein WCL18_02750 [bacterium]